MAKFKLNKKDTKINIMLQEYIKKHKLGVMCTSDRHSPLCITTLQTIDIDGTEKIEASIPDKVLPHIAVWKKKGKMYCIVEVYTYDNYKGN